MDNTHLMGYQPFDILPAYLRQFSVCLIPYHVNELMMGVDPIKLREYFSLGKPVVSVDLPEVRKHAELTYIGTDEDDFVAKVGLALKENDPELREKRMQFALQSDWPHKVDEISDILEKIIRQKKRI
jgi:glycosyltransferase involved in cell wall biosynthesis